MDEGQADSIQLALIEQLTEALQAKIRTNKGNLPPFRIPGIVKTIHAALLDYEQHADLDQVKAVGETLNQQGLSLISILTAYGEVISILAAQHSDQPQKVKSARDFFTQIIASFSQLTLDESTQNHTEMERAYKRTLAKQIDDQNQLLSTIRELSTPIIPIYAGVLVLPLVGSLNDRRAAEITERLLETIAEQQAEIVIIDITGVSLIDTSTANHLLMTARATKLLGSQVILVGLSAEIAQTIVHLGVDLQGLITLANLQDGLVYALSHFGLGINTY